MRWEICFDFFFHSKINQIDNNNNNDDNRTIVKKRQTFNMYMPHLP